MAEPASKRPHTKRTFCGQHPTNYSNWQGSTPRIASVLTPFNDENMRLAAQIGITDVVYYDMDTMPSSGAELKQLRERCESFGLRLSAVEGGPPMDLVVQGKPGRDEQIQHYIKCIEAMGEAGIPVLCYNFMPWSFRVGRTSYEVPIRGGALSSEWRWEHFDDTIRTEEGETTHDDMWASLEYFLKAVIPAAEKAGQGGAWCYHLKKPMVAMLGPMLVLNGRLISVFHI
eukprot:m.66684 g.66684  ORF g.66684 m.66684 type:complete len:229 (-) comp14064_c0_seq11:1489-2175(-)